MSIHAYAYGPIPTKESSWDALVDAYGFDLTKATKEQIDNRAIELCEEYAGQYESDSIEYATFMALKAQWSRVLFNPA
jgi:hypothetical protein